MITFAGIGLHPRELPTDPNAVFLALVQGRRHLFRIAREILHRIVAIQEPPFCWLPRPIADAPVSPRRGSTPNLNGKNQRRRHSQDLEAHGSVSIRCGCRMGS